MMRTTEAFLLPASARAKARAGSRRRLDESVGAFGTDSPPLLGLMACRITHSARFARCVRTDAASQLLKRAARAAMSPAVLGASYARRRLPARSFAAPMVAGATKTNNGSRRDGGHPAGAISGSASRRAGTRAVQWTARAARAAGPQGPARPARPGPGEARTQCVLRRLTHGICSSAAPAGRVASYAVLARAEQASPDENSPGDCSRLASGRAARPGAACKASAVGAQRRPTRHEPLAGAPWRDARRRSNA